MQRQVFGLGGVAAGYIAAVKFYKPALSFAGSTDSAMAKAGSFISIFVLCKIAVSLAGRLLSSLFKSSSLTLLNRTGGALLGLLKGLIVIMIIVLAVLSFLPADSSLITDSQTLPYLASLPQITGSVVPDDMRKKYNEKVDELRKVQKRAGAKEQ
jgi:uncharacterized membrane protein required for colicin V production